MTGKGSAAIATCADSLAMDRLRAHKERVPVALAKVIPALLSEVTAAARVLTIEALTARAAIHHGTWVEKTPLAKVDGLAAKVDGVTAKVVRVFQMAKVGKVSQMAKVERVFQMPMAEKVSLLAKVEKVS